MDSESSYPMIPRRVSARGKFLFTGADKLYIRGVTYGTFRPAQDGVQFPPVGRVRDDFIEMVAAGVNAVRVYTPPPIWLLNLAAEQGLYVMVGLPWEQHIAFLDEAGRANSIERSVRLPVRSYGDHPAILCYVIGNEIPSTIVRWHGRKQIERFIQRLYRAVKDEAPSALVTYVNYPTTEYLSLPFLDFYCFNVYLETPKRLDAYLAELQTIAGDKPLILAEVGLDSRRNGEAVQAETLGWQVRTIFAAGCAGTFIFSWTDEWHRGGYEIDDWDFGLTRRDRTPKPALEVVSAVFAQTPFSKDIAWPSISVVVCTHNGARNLADCLDGLAVLAYPNFEVIVVDDGSSDESPAIARDYDVRLIQTENRGLSAARNTGMQAAAGEIIAFIDDDAWPDPHWLQYIAWIYLTSDYKAVGGPNIPPRDGRIAECVANAPGGPIHVMLSDRDAEHIPGCNFSIRKDVLQRLGGFDPRFRTAGDDVDLCWRLLDQKLRIGFHAGAMVWHRRRDSVTRYWKQQQGYGRAEAQLQAKWPSKYSVLNGTIWSGRIYASGRQEGTNRGRVFHGVWGTAAFQRLYTSPSNAASLLTFAFDGPFLVVALIVALALSLRWPSVGVALAPLAILLLISLGRLVFSLWSTPRSCLQWRDIPLTVFLHLTQPFARMFGRLDPRRPGAIQGLKHWTLPRKRFIRVWNEVWKAPEAWLSSVESQLIMEHSDIRRGGDFDSWDLEIHGGRAGSVRLGMAIEEHGAGKQMALFRLAPRMSPASQLWAIAVLLGLALSVLTQSFLVGIVTAAVLLRGLYRIGTDCGAAMAAAESAVMTLHEKASEQSPSVPAVTEVGSSG